MTKSPRCPRCKGAMFDDVEGKHCFSCGHVVYREDLSPLFGGAPAPSIGVVSHELHGATSRRPGEGAQRHTSTRIPGASRQD